MEDLRAKHKKEILETLKSKGITDLDSLAAEVAKHVAEKPATETKPLSVIYVEYCSVMKY